MQPEPDSGIDGHEGVSSESQRDMPEADLEAPRPLVLCTREAKGEGCGWEWGCVPVDAWQLHPPVNVTQGKSWHLEQSHELCSLQSKLSYSRPEPGPERMGFSRRNMKGLDPMIVKILPSSSLCCSQHTRPWYSVLLSLLALLRRNRDSAQPLLQPGQPGIPGSPK